MTNTVPQVAAALIQRDPQDLIAISMTSDGLISVSSAGNVDTSKAIVLLGNALAVVYKEMSEEQLKETPIAQVLNNLGVVTTARLQQMMPQAFGNEPSHTKDVQPLDPNEEELPGVEEEEEEEDVMPDLPPAEPIPETPPTPPAKRTPRTSVKPTDPVADGTKRVTRKKVVTNRTKKV